MAKITDFAFCEIITATSRSLWHIRKLSVKGLKLEGGADTTALCGTIVARDLETELTESHLTQHLQVYCCQKCVQELGKYKGEK